MTRFFAALTDKAERSAKIATLDRYLNELEAELGPASSDEQVAAREWADRALGAVGDRAAEKGTLG